MATTLTRRQALAGGVLGVAAAAVGARRVPPFALASADGGGSSWLPGGDDPFGR